MEIRGDEGQTDDELAEEKGAKDDGDDEESGKDNGTEGVDHIKSSCNLNVDGGKDQSEKEAATKGSCQKDIRAETEESKRNVDEVVEGSDGDNVVGENLEKSQANENNDGGKEQSGKVGRSKKDDSDEAEKIMSQLKKGANNVGNDEESGKENKRNGYGVDERGDGDKDIGGNCEKFSANENNDEGNDKEDGSDEEEKDDELNKDNKANGDGDGANGDRDDDKSGKDSETDGSGEKDSSDEEETNDESDKENEANGEGDDGCSDGDNGSNDNHDKKSAKEGGYEKKPRPSVNNLVKPDKKQPY
jgi:hypothetical protein